MIAAVVPIKRLSQAKSRLAERLTTEERTRLAVFLLGRTVAALRRSGRIARVAVATPEENVARGLGVEWIEDAGSLNGSLGRAAVWAVESGAEALLIVPPDLPMLSTADIEAVAGIRYSGPNVVIAETRDGGTGALLLSPPDVVAPAFGPGSFSRHRAAAEALGVTITVLDREGLGRDLDTASDLDELQPWLFRLPL
jgi:2-phospho-L-lactate/phosphoenolpyruvate guanylyltransferase